jgi:tetratricopeptide (TPR) repeat protein
MRRIAFTLIAAMLFAGTALAAGSKEKESDKPGTAEYNAGVSLMKREKFAEAQSKFEAALAIDGKLAEAHNNLAYSLRKQGPENFDRALEHYDRAIELAPKLAEAYMYRGVLHALMGDEQKALADHAKLVDLDRKLADALQAAIASGEEPEGLEGLAKKW